MAPLEDRSQISINTRGAEGVTYEYIRDYTEDINLLVDSITPDAEAVTARVSSGSGNIRITLKDMQDRDYTQMEVAEKLSKAVQKKTMARSFVQQSSSFGGRRGGMPVQYVLQATNIEKLQEVLPKFMAKVYENPVFQMADVDLKFSKPEARININRDKASIMGVSTRNIAQTLQYGLSGQRMGYFYMNGKQYEILGEINRQQRNKPADLKGIYIRSSQGDMVQLDNLIELTDGIAPPKLYRYNRFVSATISAGLADGKTIGQGLDEMDKIAKETLDDTFRTALTGDSKEYRESSSSLMFAFILAILLIYLILAAQFESFKDPLIIMLTVPCHCRSIGIHVFRRHHDEYIQPNRHHHADWSGSKERNPDCRVRQSETGSRRGQDASHQRCRPATSASYPDDKRFYRTGIDTAGFRNGRRLQPTHRHGYGRSRRYARIHSAHDVHRPRHL